MSGLMHAVATAALPVAIGLVGLAAGARAIIALQLDHAPALRLAAQYLDALALWALAAVATYVLAVGLAGELGPGSLILAVVLGVAAVLARSMPGEAEETGPAPVAGKAPPPQTPAPTPEPTGAHSLWVDTREDDPTARTGLWSRA
jgi:hypothetical protein